jgi:hypothetical protein
MSKEQAACLQQVARLQAEALGGSEVQAACAPGGLVLARLPRCQTLDEGLVAGLRQHARAHLLCASQELLSYQADPTTWRAYHTAKRQAAQLVWLTSS